MPQETIIPGYRLSAGETITYTARAASLGRLVKTLRRVNPADVLDDDLEIALFETWLAGLESEAADNRLWKQHLQRSLDEVSQPAHQSYIAVA